jgi:hypothetical protein
MSVEPQVVAVVDSNVLLDLISCHNYTRKFEPVWATKGDGAWRDAGVDYRGSRACDALLLAIYLDQIRATTWSSHGELDATARRIVPPRPELPGGGDWERDYLTQVIHFVMEVVLKNWKATAPESAELERGNDNDRWLVAEARRLNVDLISTEGLKPDGSIDVTKTVHKEAALLGVRVVTPRAFFRGKLLDEEAAAEAYLRRFAEQIPIYCKDRTDKLEELLGMMYRYQDMILTMHAPV